MDRVKVTVTVDDRKVTIEGPSEFVRQEVERFATAGRAIGGEASPPSVTERTFYESKNPKNHAEAVAVLGFWLTEIGQPEFSEADIRRLYLRAGIRPPKVVAQALRDAKNRFDYVEPGSRRGSFRMTDHGDRTVRFDLPRS